MPWIISFIVSWILFLIVVDKASLKTNVFGGVLAVTLASIVDWGGQKLELYTFKEVIIPWFTCSAFYKFGPIFTMGILFAQSIPKKKIWQALNIFAFTIIYLALEYTVIQTGVAEYLHWHILASFIVNVLTLTSLTWFTLTFLRRA
ncbi:MAG: hypothetical protein A2Y21_11525 [Clostridiales bacterium GWC2_40_7]|nr:MAG: hypothetical protein A2Y21_11525 [Clostridiales bacterium GWC2_40_7]